MREVNSKATSTGIDSLTGIYEVSDVPIGIRVPVDQYPCLFGCRNSSLGLTIQDLTWVAWLAQIA